MNRLKALAVLAAASCIAAASGQAGAQTKPFPVIEDKSSTVQPKTIPGDTFESKAIPGDTFESKAIPGDTFEPKAIPGDQFVPTMPMCDPKVGVPSQGCAYSNEPDRKLRDGQLSEIDPKLTEASRLSPRR